MSELRRIVTAKPENSETPLDQVRTWVTPTPWFFVRNHFDLPSIDLATWRLRVDGCVDHPLELSWQELVELPERSLFVTIECAGNGRSFLQPRADGVQWGAGAVGHAEWTGVPLHTVLERARLRPEVVEIVFEGADRGTESDHPEPMAFAHGLPIRKALHPDTLLAYAMNGEPLTPSHGFPLRLLVPGWYGVASVKWLTRIAAVSNPFQGYFQTVKYTVRKQTGGDLRTEAVGPMLVKSEIVRPQQGAALGMGSNRIFGVAWGGEDPVHRVEVSTDAGRTWNEAEVISPKEPYCWRLWQYIWEVGHAGDYTLMCRAISEQGVVQPNTHDPLAGGYLINHIRPIRVRVEAAQRSAEDGAEPDALLYDINAWAEANTRFPLDVELEFGVGEGI